jgi:hypothetical protein
MELDAIDAARKTDKPKFSQNLMLVPVSLPYGHQDRLLPMTPDFAEFLLNTPHKEREGLVFMLKCTTNAQFSRNLMLVSVLYHTLTRIEAAPRQLTPVLWSLIPATHAFFRNASDNHRL